MNYMSTSLLTPPLKVYSQSIMFWKKLNFNDFFVLKWLWSIKSSVQMKRYASLPAIKMHSVNNIHFIQALENINTVWKSLKLLMHFIWLIFFSENNSEKWKQNQILCFQNTREEPKKVGQNDSTYFPKVTIGSAATQYYYNCLSIIAFTIWNYLQMERDRL